MDLEELQFLLLILNNFFLYIYILKCIHLGNLFYIFINERNHAQITSCQFDIGIFFVILSERITKKIRSRFNR